MIHGAKVKMKSIIGIDINTGIHLSPRHLDLEFLTWSLEWITGAK